MWEARRESKLAPDHHGEKLNPITQVGRVSLSNYCRISQVSRDEWNEYYGITNERAARILDALGVEATTRDGQAAHARVLFVPSLLQFALRHRSGFLIERDN